MIVGLTYDLRGDYLAQGYKDEDVAEFDSEETIAALDNAIQSLGYQTERIGNARSLCQKLASGKRWDLVFNIAEGLSGRCRESQVPALLEIYQVGYTFSDPLACAVTLDKSFAKRLVRAFKLPTAGFVVVNNMSDIKHITLKYPLFAKPVAEGTGKGVDRNSLIESRTQLKQVCEFLLERFAQPVLVEEFLPGREFTAAVLGNGDEAYVLGVMEIKVPQDKKANIYSYTAKERCEKLVTYLPYRKGPLYKKIVKLALESYKALQCNDAARVDVRCDRKGLPCFLEINPLPGLHPAHSDLPMIATQEGMSYNELIDRIIKIALSRLGVVGRC
jgi:D-alanine-D-alanine ligase